MLKQLMEPILEGGIQHVNFFNGRLLSGEDMNGERDANRAARRRLGRGLGDGVAYGLEVRDATGRTLAGGNGSAPALPIEVQPGLAINLQGDPLLLQEAVFIPLANLPGTVGDAGGAAFQPCRPPEGGEYVAGAGVYLLTIGAVNRGQGRAPVSGLGNAPASCNIQFLVEGVRFNSIQLTLTRQERDQEARLRNRLAYRCYGYSLAEPPPFALNPFAPVRAYGLVDMLRRTCLSDDQVPLALIYLTATGGIRFVDMWAVRRRLARRTATEASDLLDDDPTGPGRFDWAWLAGDRRCRENEAMLLQFEDQVEDILAREAGSAPGLRAADRFDYLPPVGLLRISPPPNFLAVTPSIAPRGFSAPVFFADSNTSGAPISRAARDVALIDFALLRSLVRESFDHEPINLPATKRIQLYLIYENVRAVEQGQTADLALVFASPTLPYRGVARYGYARRDLSRFAPGAI